MYFIGIDIGTSSICGVVYNSSTQEVVSVTKDNHTHIASAYPWEKAQDPAAIIDIVSGIIREFRDTYADIQGIGLTGQMHGMLYVDKTGEAVSPLYTWQDGRGNLVYKEGTSYAACLQVTTGYPLATGFGLVTHYYNAINNLVPERAAKLCTIMDYAVMKLAGRNTPLSDYSNAASLGFFDKKRLAFDTEALAKAGIGEDILPEVKPSASLAGHFEGIPVYSAIGDNQASFLGSVSDIEHSIHITIGTSSQISVYTDQYIEVESLDTRPLPGGGYILVGAELCGGSAFAILKNFFRSTVTLFTESRLSDGGLPGAELSDADLYRMMTSIDYSFLNTEQYLEVKTLFDGTRANPSERGSISRISTSNFTPENLIVGFVKGIAQSLYHYYELLPESIRKEKTILVGSGNGIKKNPLVRKAIEERFGSSIHPSAIREEAAFGACLRAANHQ